MNLWELIENFISDLSGLWNWLTNPVNFGNFWDTITNMFKELFNEPIAPITIFSVGSLTIIVILKVVKAVI